jgi:hypothetical protein
MLAAVAEEVMLAIPLVLVGLAVAVMAAQPIMLAL